MFTTPIPTNQIIVLSLWWSEGVRDYALDNAPHPTPTLKISSQLSERLLMDPYLNHLFNLPEQTIITSPLIIWRE